MRTRQWLVLGAAVALALAGLSTPEVSRQAGDGSVLRDGVAQFDSAAAQSALAAEPAAGPEDGAAAGYPEAAASPEPLRVEAWVITVNGQEVVAVATRAEAEQAIAEIQTEYKETVLKDAATVEQLQFLESIGFVPRQVDPAEIRTKDEAKEVLRYGTEKRIFYTVQRGDTLWDIAVRQGLTVEELMAANPGIEPELLQPGQQINMTVSEPYVHLASTEVQVYTERIPFPQEVQEDPELWPWQVRVIQPGEPGQREVKVRIYRKDGQEVGREVLETRVLKEPVKQIVARGTRQAPPLGTGQFYWPVQGAISDSFGWTGGRYHNGVDITAPPGTPVHAADSGIVVHAGWQGRYGLLVQIDHGEGKVVTYYAHLSKVAVSPGEQVERGQVIGYVGSTGYSTGPHLHFEVRVDGRWVNPLKFYP